MALTQTKFMLETCFNKKTVAAVPATPATGTLGTTGYVAAKPAVPEYYNYTPIMIVMSLTRGVLTPATKEIPAGPGGTPARVDAKPAAIQSFETIFNLPLLTIVPLNSLAVQTVDVNFEMEVKSSYSEDQKDMSSTDKSAQASLEATLGWGPLSVSIKGSVSYDQKDSSEHDTHYQKSNSAKYTVNVHAGQLPLPKGVTTIIEAFAQSISPIQMPAPA